MKARYQFVVSMDIPSDKETLFNEVYDNEHIPSLSAVPGVLSATRLVREPLRMMLAGERLTSSREPISQISLSLGYESESAFSTAFKRVMGCPPRSYCKEGLPRSDVKMT